MTDKPVIEAAKEQTSSSDDEILVRHGVRGRLVPVSVGLVQDVLRKLEQPVVPTWQNPDKGREEENPNDPAYLRALDRYRTEQSAHTTEALLMFGIELLDPPPKDGEWLGRLRLMCKLNTLDLSWVDDWDDATTQEFLFKRYVWSQRGDIKAIDQLSSIEEAARRAEAGF